MTRLATVTENQRQTVASIGDTSSHVGDQYG